jgi:hypothetical protein
MESKSNNTKLIKDEIKYTVNITAIDYNHKLNLLSVGDKNGRISLFDVRTNKPIKLIKTKVAISNIKSEGEKLFFTCEDSNMLNYCDVGNKQIFNENDITNSLNDLTESLKEVDDVFLFKFSFQSIQQTKKEI